MNKIDRNKSIIFSFPILFFILITFIVVLADPVPTRSVEITSNYSGQGSWTINKSAEWISANKARITLELNSQMKTSGRNKDIILVMDVSGSMSGSKLNKAKEDAKDLVSTLLTDSNNRIALITFESTASKLSDLTNNATTLNDLIDNLTVSGSTNYNSGLVETKQIIDNYTQVSNKDLVVLFLTDGFPNLEVPNQVSTYQIIKEQYPYVIINAIQYEMGKDIIQDIIDISDNQFIASMETLNNVLFEACTEPEYFENFKVEDYINENFEIESIGNISSTKGTVNLSIENGLQKVTWNLGNNYRTHTKETLTIDILLKEQYQSLDTLFETNDHERITSKLESDTEKEVNSQLTPILQGKYTVIYDTNTPSGCSLSNIPSEKHKPFELVTIIDDELSCSNYIFRGYEVEDLDVKKINTSSFIMPSHDVTIRVTWSKVSISKSMDGEVATGATLYKVLKNEYKSGSGLARLYTGSHQDSMDASKSIKDIYYYYGNSDTNGTAILDKNNVIFAGQCWQMIRTTDTGGVRIIYNGEAVNNQCLNTRSNHIGYASRTTQNLASSYWYGTDYSYDSTNNVFSIAGATEQTTWNATTGPGLVGKYTCKQTTVAGTCSTLYLIESYNSVTSAYVIPLNTNSHYSQFGRLQFNTNYHSPADVGYMYNTRYTKNSKTMTNSETMLQSTSLNTSYWYADSITWGSPTANSYNLDSPYQVSSTSDYPNLVGEYTFRDATQTYTATSVYYIAVVNGSYMYYIQLTNSGNHTLSDFNYTYTYGDSYIDNGNGTYTIDNPTTINRSDWYTGYSSVGTGKYVCKNATNNTCTDLWYTTSTDNTRMTYIKVSNNYKYAKSFDYRLDPDDNTYKYFLDDSTTISFWNINDSSNKTSLNNAHYTCFNTSGKCTTISYIYYLSEITPYYINLTGGKSVEIALNEMLTDSSINTTNSIMKNGVDAWYKKYLLDDYDSYIDDTIYCNDRSIRALNGWDPDGGSLTDDLQFKESSDGTSVGTDLSCTNTTDRFSVSNANARLTYKVGLMSRPEMNLLGTDNARKTGQYYWLASPSVFIYSDVAYSRIVNTYGGWSNDSVSYAHGVRPAISLIPGIGYSSGDGSMADPYVVDTQ